MQDVTNSLDALKRGLIISNSSDGIMIDGDTQSFYHRRFNSPTMRHAGSETVFYRTGEIMHDVVGTEDRYYVVYRTKKNEENGK